MFVTFEGIEGCGKTTQARLLYEWLLSKGESAVLTREPGGTPAGEEIRRLLLAYRGEKFPPFAELCLYIADRSFHVQNLILPSLEKGRHVVCDRFSDSTVAYQGYGRGLNIELIRQMNRRATGSLVPDVTFLIDVPVEVGLSRLRRSPDRMEGEPLEFHQKVRQGFLKIAEENPDRVVVVDGTQSVESVFSQVVERVKGFLNCP
jgi:dTMP kinase